LERGLQNAPLTMNVRLLAPVAVVLAAGLAACGSGGGTSPPDGPLSRAFEASARTNGVPRDLMVAIAQTEGGLAMPAHRDVDPQATVPVAGPLELRHGAFDSLARGAALMQTSELALRTDADLGLEAGARVLADLASSRGADARDLATWKSVLEDMSGYSDTAHREHYAHRVFALLARGGTFAGRDGETIVLPAHDELPPTLTLDLSSTVRILTAPAEYGPAEWFPTPQTNKWTAGRPNGAVDRIVIHDTEGGWDASVATLQNDPGKSVHYIVGQDGRVGQFVLEGDTAWHAGNWFYNTKSVGIEHVGYYTQSYPDAEYAASADLVKYLVGKYNVAADRTHIVGHDQIPNGNVMPEDSAPCEDSPYNCEQGTSYGGSGNHRDPGDWEWCLYMVERVGGTCKCNDIWNLWNCSSDHTEAFRCDNGKIEIEHCDGPGACVSQPNGVDDVCNMAPIGSDAGTPPRTDGGATHGGDGGGQPPPSSGSDGGNGAAPPPGGGIAAGPSSASADSSGCSVVAPGSASAPAILGLALGTVALRRRRRRG
jgi:MYXO-CTERM domain-containing protein